MSIILKCNECGHLYSAHEEPGSCMVAGCNCGLDRVAVLLDCIAALEAEKAKLIQAYHSLYYEHGDLTEITTDEILAAQEPA